MPQRFRMLYIFYAIVMKFLVIIYLPLGFTLLFCTISAEDANISNLLTSLQVTFDVYGGSVKFIILSFLLLKLRKTNVLTHRLDKRCRAADEIVELHRMVRFGQKVVLLFLLNFISYAVTTFLGAVIKGHPPYAMYYPFLEWRRSNVEFFFVSLFDFFLIHLACIQQTINDAYPVVYINILRTHIKTLLLRIDKLGTSSLEQNLVELKLCIKDHQLLIELYNIIAPMTSITIFVQFTVTAICIGTGLINLVVFSNEFSSRVGCCFFIIAVAMEIFPTCYYAQCLIDDSNQISDVIFHSNWVEQSKEYRQLLIFFMQRTQRPMFLTAGKLFPVTLNSFLSIAKFSFSLYTLMENMNLKERLGME
ncbi:odorant receptor 42a-like [Eurosta solidaginis]|uniref:odorant receptor 42a-like n=1 Tax=Eurosta solidaginis TaxID=178769 RepID=UPI003530CB96